MRKLTYALKSAFFTLSRTTLLFLFVAMISQNIWGQCTPENNSISGTVFEDKLNDGIFKDADVGLSNVLVKAYDEYGDEKGSSVSDVNGEYTIANLPNGKSYRLVFESTSTFYSSVLGEDNRSSVQFVESPACEINYGLTRSNGACESNPDLVLTCFVQGAIDENPSVETIISVEHDFTGTSQVSKIAMQSETGAIWGIVHDPQTEALYSASFVKQYAGLKYTPYTILKTEMTGDKKTTAFVDVNSLIPQDLPGLTVTDVEDCSYGEQVGRVGLGSIILAPDGGKLYTTVLDEGLVVGIDIADPTPQNTDVFAMPRPINIDPTEEYRIFAMTWHEGKIYVGGTVTASVSKDKNVSSAVIMTLDPGTGATQEIFRTNYIQGHWQDTKPESLNTSHWLTDLDFTDSGEILMSLTDRIGHRYCKPSTNRLDQQFPDLLIVGWDEVKEEWILEDNGSINGREGSGVGNDQGPGGGEFFGFDFWPTNSSYHSETALGSIFVLPGSNEVVATVYDPLINSYSGGLHRYSTLDGNKSGAIELYTHTTFPVFGKATGFGDITGICKVESIEIGNYVWNDTNGNGLQDPGEEGIPNVGLNLYNSDCELIGTTQTDEDGIYAFNDSNVDADGDGEFDGVFPDVTYYVGIDNAIYDETTGLYTLGTDEFTICTANSGTESDDNIDCDAEYSATSCLSTAFIEVNTGVTNHSFDIGLGAPSGFDLALKKEIVGNQFAQVGEEMRFLITVYNQGGASASAIKIVDYMPSGFSFDEDENNGWKLENGILETTIEQKLLPGKNVSKLLKLVVTNTQAASYLNIAEISKAWNLAGVEQSDVDSTPDTNPGNDEGGIPFTSTDDQLNGVGILDEDDHDAAIPKIFDLAVKITLAEDKYYYADDVVKFDIKLYNQGNVAADLVELTNYFTEELSLNTTLSDGWKIVGDNAVLEDFEILEAGEVRDYCIYFDVAKGILPAEVLNFVEISKSSPVDYEGSLDFDSKPDDLDDNDEGGEVYTNTDNEVNDHGLVDEDDHDPEVIKTRYVDLALMKTTVKKSVRSGENVEFKIEIINQGSAPVYKFEIVDYIPEFMKLNDDNWEELPNGNAITTIEMENPLTKGQAKSVNIILKIEDNLSPRSFVNYAEISGAKNDENIEIGVKDIDSTPDRKDNNDNGGIPNTDTDDEVDSSKDVDEDDHDPAQVFLIEGSIENSECLENATNSNDGQFEDIFKITAPAGETWYLFDQSNYYDISSPDPADGPLVELVVGEATTMTEMAIDAEMSMYTFAVIREDGRDGFISFRNLETDDIETFNVPAMMYEDIFITGDLALCQGESRVYCVGNPDPDLDYEWTVPMGVSFTTLSPTCIEIDWSGVAANADYDISVEADEGCYVPGAATISIGTSSGAMSCLGFTNLSLDGDCEVQITPALILTSDILPGQAYSVMLTTESGEVIPNATLTSEHLGMTITAKVIDGCSGNACWGTILVEDKIKPTIQCEDAFISCNKIDEFGGPFAEDNCGGPVEVIMLNETFTPLQCDAYSAEIYRTYQAVDASGNVSDICEMTIFVEHIDLDDIIFPDNLIMMDGTALNCDAYDLDMDGVADVHITGKPIYNGEYVYPDFDPLCNTSITFEDDVRFINGVKKIKRTWTAWNWYCSTTITREHEQFIEIRDIEDPIIECPDDVTISAAVGNCEGILNLPLPTVSDACSDDITIQTITQVTSIIEEGDSRIVSFPYSAVPYVVTYRATDASGNSAECEMTVTVIDDIAPIAICDQNTIVGLNSNGEGYLYAMNLDDGSYDACQLTDMKIRRVEDNGPFADKVLFNCDDLDESIMVELLVMDAGGLTNSCMANVTVQDKHAPEVNDLPDVTIECGDSFTPLSQFGEFTYNDACDVTTTEDSIISINTCGTGTITRTFTASDSDGSDVGIQTITIINSNPFDEDDIVRWPLDYDVTLSTCDDDDLHPDDLPAPYDYPVWNDDSCDQVSAGFHDDIYPLIDDPNSVCYKIVRHWTIIDWCQMDINGDPIEFNEIQIIKVTNTKAPDPIVVTPEIDTIVSSDCDNGLLNLTATTDDCAPDLLNWTIQIDLDQDFISTGVYDITRTGFGPEATFNEEIPQGTHNVVFSFSNGCGNTETTSRTVTIINNIPPNILCLSSTSVGLGPWNLDDDPEPDTEAACVYVDSLIVESGTFHPCDTDFELSFSADSIVKKMCFDCNDIGINILTIYAIDIYGNVSSCIDTLDVQDNNDIDICIDPKDCATEIQDTTISLESGCIVFVGNTDFDVTQMNDECGELTITNDLTGTSTLNGAQLMLGVNTITWTISNGPITVDCPQTITVIDEIDPTISCGDDISLSTSDFAGCEYIQMGSGLDPGFNDNCNIANVYHDYVSAPSIVTLDGAAFPIGETVVTWTVEDEAGNSDMCQITVTIIEGADIECNPIDVTINLDENGVASIVPGDVINPGTAECGGVPTVSVEPLDFDCGDIGDNPVTIKLFIGQDSVVCTANVTVQDVLFPTITCAPEIQVFDTNDGDLGCSHSVADGSLDPVVASDNCDNFTITHNYDMAVNNTTLDGAEFPVGMTVVEWTITDNGGSGLSSNCDIMITVVDNTPPDCVDQGTIPLEIAVGDEVTLTTSLLPNAYTDNCGIESIIFNPPTLDCSDEGLVDVTITVTDVNTNASDCVVEFDVSVMDSVSCALNIDTAYLDINGEINLVAEDVVDITGGSCGQDLIPTLSSTSFLCNDLNGSPYDITIFVNGDSCGVGSLMLADTIGPEIFCSPISISCTSFENDFNGSINQVLNQTEATDSIWDNCVALLEETTLIDSSAVNECKYGVVTRTTIVVDENSGKSDTCVQMITIEGPADPLTQADVEGILPDTVILTDCVVGDIMIDSITDADLDQLVDCGLFNIGFVDLSISQGCPDTILRTYTIEAICQEESFEWVQVVVVNDDINPVIAEIADTSLVADLDCFASLDIGELVSATDDCTPSDMIPFTYFYDNVSAGVETIANFEVGTYDVSVVAADGCGNTDTTQFEVSVIDTVALDVLCIKLIVTIDTATQTVDVPAELNVNIVGNCDDEAEIYVTYDSLDLSDTVMTFDCDDVGLFIGVDIFAWEILNGDTIPFDLVPSDTTSVINLCKGEIEVRDTLDACPTTILEITGTLNTPDGFGIPDYSLTLHGSGLDPEYSNGDGDYAFPPMPAGGNYIISTYNNNDVMNGINTLDLILIQRHVLGLTPFDSPYKYIAADINNSEKVSGADILELRKMILGINPEFPNNMSWRAIDAGFTFEDPSDPWLTPIPESYKIPSLNQDMDVDFVGIKIGDVDGTVSVNLNAESSTTRSNDAKVLMIERDENSSALQVYADEDLDIAGLQFTLDLTDMNIIDIISDHFASSEIGFYQMANGKINVSVASNSPISIDANEAIFEIITNCSDCKITSNSFKLSNTGLASELYINESIETVPMEFDIRSDDEDESLFIVYQNNPNPWTNHTKIDISLPRAENVDVKVYDVNGRLVTSSTQRMNAGMNTIEFDNLKITSSGVFYYEISTSTRSERFKMIKLN